jgi:hypothetical protein
MKGAKDPEKWLSNEDDWNTNVGVQTKKLKPLDPDFIDPPEKQKSYFEYALP